MSDSPLRIVPPPPAPPEPLAADDAPDEPTTADELNELRRLLIEPEQVQLNNLLTRLNNPRVRAREQSRTLPEAVRLRSAEDDALQTALAPTVVKALHDSVKRDPRPLVLAIAPLLGPAIRRAVALALSSTLQRLDQTLTHSLSWQGWKWRIEAVRTHQPFAQVVLARTLVYRVEQVFLIHKQTGLLLQHVTAQDVAAQDADIVSGMFTAIQDFVRDAFGEQQDGTVNTLSVGECTVWIETGAHAYLAAVIRGRAAEGLRVDYLNPTIEAIHYEQREALDVFDGDVAPFETCRPHLEQCLQAQYQGKAEQASARVRVILVLLLVVFGIVAALTGRSYWRWSDYVNRLNAEPGIVVVDARWRFGWPVVAGLRDPLATDPAEILRRHTKLDPAAVSSRWEPYQALHPQFTLARAQSLLAPPATVNLTLDNEVLVATGTASQRWIADAQRIARTLPGVTGFRADGLVNADWQATVTAIEGRVLRFVSGTTQLAAGQTGALEQVAAEIKELFALATASGRSARIEIIGHTDTEGSEASNLRLSQQRAERMLAALVAQGINADKLSARGVGTGAPVRAESSAADKEFSRNVSFKVVQ